MFLLTNPVRDYAWGSPRLLARFLEREAPGTPEAELWVGAHEGDPSLLADGRRLDRAIAGDPVALLGSRVHAEHGARLPFLMKLLAVEQPLSLQVHPSSERARLGFAREERAGVPRDSPERSYKDPWHKPELVYALTRFEGMAGLRDVERSCALLSLLRHPWADKTAGRLESGFPSQTLHRVVADILTLGPHEVAEVLSGLVPAAREAAVEGHRQERVRGSRHRAAGGPAAVRREAIRVFELFPSLAARYPTDPGVLVTLLLNHVVLAPGEAMYVGAGVLHAYASGFGVEIMAASDNVLRAGLTPKHRDVPELLAVTDFTPIPPPRWEPVAAPSGQGFHPPVSEFALGVLDGGDRAVPGDGPRLVLALGRVAVEAVGRDERLELTRGQAAYLAPHDPGYRVTGSAAVGSVPV